MQAGPEGNEGKSAGLSAVCMWHASPTAPIAPLQRCDAKVRVKMQAFRWAAMLQRKRGRGGGQPSAP